MSSRFLTIEKYTPQRGPSHKVLLTLLLLVVPIIIIAAWVAVGLNIEATQAAAGVPRLMNYQGKIASSTGAALPDGDYGFCFEFFDSQSGGSSYGWNEDWTSLSLAGEVPIKQGIFSANLGSSTPIDDSIFYNDNVYLQVSFDADDNGSCEEIFYPRKRVTAAAYAMNAEAVGGYKATTTATAGQLLALDSSAGMTLSSITTTAGLVSQGDAYFGGRVSVGASVWSGGLLTVAGDINLEGSGSYNIGGASVLRGTSSVLSVNNDGSYNYVLVPYGNMSVGTSITSSYKFLVAGDAYISGTTTASCFTIDGVNCLAGSSSSQWITSGSDIYYDSGFVGIGTDSPLRPLHVIGTGNSAGLFDVYSGDSSTTIVVPGISYRVARGTAAAPLALQTDDILAALGGQGYNGSAYSTGGHRAYMALHAAESWTTTSNGTYINWATTPNGSTTRAERMRITDQGNIGIGTTTPQERLVVGGNAVITGAATADSLTLGNLEGFLYASGGTVSTSSIGGADLSGFTEGNLVFGNADGTLTSSSNLYFNSSTNFLTVNGRALLQGNIPLQLKNPAASGTVSMFLGDTDYSGYLAYDSSSSVFTVGSAGNASALALVAETGPMIFKYGSGGNTEGMRMLNGHLLLGTAVDSGYKLHVSGTAYMSDLVIDNLNGLLYANSGLVGTTSLAALGVTSSQWITNGSDIYYDTGNVSIGTTSAVSALTVSGDVDITGSYMINGQSIFYTDPYNYYAGYEAGNAASNTASSTYNVAIGSYALASNIGVENSVAIGYQALQYTTSSDGNIAIGRNALRQNLDGFNNLAIGTAALEANISGTSNVGVGAAALFANTIGQSNTAIGSSALSSNIDGSFNSALGNSALASNANGSLNTAFGWWALKDNDSNSNSAFGTLALAGSVSGDQNIAIGYSAGYSGTVVDDRSVSDSRMVFIGYDASRDGLIVASTTSLTNGIAIGYGAKVGGSNMMVLGGLAASGTAVNVGINTSTPSHRLTVVGDAYISGTTTIGGPLSVAGTVSSTALQVNGNATITSLTLDTLDGLLWATNGVVAVTSSSGLLPSASDGQLLVYNSGWQASSQIYVATSTGYVGIGTTTPNNKLQVYDLIDFGTNTDANTKIGYQAGKNIVAGAQYNTFLGYQAGFSSSTAGSAIADNNTALGYQALYFNAGGSSTVAVGYQALYNNTDGYFNTANGSQALFSNTVGANNTALGYKALFANVSGNNNVAIGDLALSSNIMTGNSNNTAVGHQSLMLNTVGYGNTAMGLGSLSANTDGHENVAVGQNALGLSSGVSNHRNTAVGFGALNSVTGDGNVALGYYAGRYETGSNSFYLDNRDRGNSPYEKTGALLYGTFSASTTPSLQTLRINASTTISQNLTVLGTSTSSFAGTVSSTGLQVNGDVQVNGSQFIIGMEDVPQFRLKGSTTQTFDIFDVIRGSNSQVIFAVNDSNTYADKLHIGVTAPPRGNLEVEGASYLNGTITAYSIIPSSTLAFDLGASTTRWNNAWINNLYLGSSTWQLSQGDNGRLAIANLGGSEKLSILTDGTVSSTKLQVNGDSTMNGSLYFNGTTYRITAGGNIGSNSLPWTNLYASNVSTTWMTSSNMQVGNLNVATVTVAQLSQQSSAISESAPVSGELADASGWTSTGWTGDYNSGFTHTSGTADDLSRSMTSTIGEIYQISFSMTKTQGSLSASFGGQGSGIGYYNTGTFSFSPRVVSTSGPLVFSPSADFMGTISNVSIKKITGTYGSTYSIKDSLGNPVLEVRSSPDDYHNTFIGLNAGSYNTAITSNAGFNNTALGADALQYNTSGNYNTAIGSMALTNNTIGYQNTAVGYLTLNDNTTGYWNVALGSNALNSNISGNRNTAVGMGALASNLTGGNNTAVGSQALGNNIGSGNVALGSYALTSNTSGGSNIAIGLSALTRSQTNSNNIGIGTNALFTNTSTADNNIALGNTALYVNLADYNIAIGDNALRENISGLNNVAIGYQAGYDSNSERRSVLDSQMVFLGSIASRDPIVASTTALTNGIAIGYNAQVATSNAMVLGNSSIKVSIGTNTPLALLHVNKNSPSTGENMFLITNGSGNLFRFSASGTAYSTGGYQDTGADYAEYFYTRDSDLTSGEAVCVDVTKSNAVVRCTRTGDDNIMGIVSTRPAIVGNSKEGYENNPSYKIVAMLGQIPAKASNENGEIRPGDYLTAASIPGYVMKAGTGDSTVGVALESLDSNTGTINVMISRRNKSLTVEQVEEAVTQRIADMELEDEVNIMLADTIQNYDFTDDIASYLNPFMSTVDAKLALLSDSLNLKVSELTSTTLGATNDLTNQISASNNLISLLNEQVSTTVSNLSVTNERLDGLDALILNNTDRLTTLELFTSSSIADLQAAITNLSVATTTGDLQVDNDLLTVNTLTVRQAADFIGTITVRGEANFEAKVTFKKPIKLASDSAGTAMIKAGEKFVEVKFSEVYDMIPKVVANLNNDDEELFISYKIANKTEAGFKIILLEEAQQDLNFDWLAFAAEEPEEEIVEELPPAEEPIVENPIAEEPIAKDSIIEDPVAEELIVAGEPAEENPITEDAVVESPLLLPEQPAEPETVVVN